MKVTLEITNLGEIEKLFSFFQTVKLDGVQVSSEDFKRKPKIKKGNKSLNPKELFGIWQESPKNIEDIRANAWQRK
ncbi:MAG: hypothetical protein U5M51_14150 [Emticicia sp.]|nr:hypothetical protein [Emticicia sp.]